MTSSEHDPSAPPDEDRNQSQLWVLLGGLALVFAYIVAFVIANSDPVEISFVVFSARTSLIWLIVLSVAIGIAGGVLLSQLYRRRSR